MNIEEIRKSVEEKLPNNRYNHTIGVMNTGIMLAKKFDVCINSTKKATLLHDIAKNHTYNELREELNLADETEYLHFSPLVWHAPVGAIIAKREYGIDDKNILNAIKYHTTGRASMSMLEKITFVADYIEPNRKQPNVEVIRELATFNLDLAVAQTLADTVSYLKSKGGNTIHPDTLDAYRYYSKYLEKK